MVKRNSGTSKEDICQNQFTAYVVLAVKRKRQAYIKKKIRDKENQAKRRKNNQILEPKRILCGIDWRFKMKN